MNIEEAKKYIDRIDDNVKNLQKLCNLPEEERDTIAKRMGIDSFDGMLNMTINCIVAYKSVLKKKIDKTEII